MTGNAPFHNIPRTIIPLKVSEGERLERPSNAAAIGLSDSLWQLVDNCGELSMERPTIRVVFDRLEEIAQDWFPPFRVAESSELDGSSWLHTNGKLKSYRLILRLFILVCRWSISTKSRNTADRTGCAY